MNQKEIAAMTEAVIGSLESLYVESGAEIPDLLEGIKIQVNGQIQQAWCNALPSSEALSTDSSVDKRVRETMHLRSQLEQERKLTTHLDGVIYEKGKTIDQHRGEIAGLEDQVRLLGLGRSAQAGTIVGQKRRIELLDAEIGRMELLVNNLREKNDSQVEIIEGMQRKTKAWTVQDNDTNATIRRLKGGLAKANEDAQKHAVMVASVVMAMEKAGYDISGWGSDGELTELEDHANVIRDEASSLSSKLDTIRTRR